MSKENVSAGKPKIGGAIYRAPLGTQLPTSATETLDPAFLPQGYVSADGVTNSSNSSSNNVKAWGGDTVLVTQADKTDTLGFTLIESLNKNVLATVHGDDNVTGDLEMGITVKVNAALHQESVWVIDMLLKGNVAKRIVAPDAVISNTADVVYKDDAAIGYGVTLTCLPDAEGNNHYEYIKGPAAAEGSEDPADETEGG